MNATAPLVVGSAAALITAIYTAIKVVNRLGVEKVDVKITTADKVMMAGFQFDDVAPDSVNDGDAGAARMSANRNVYAQLRDAAGNERGANVDASGNLNVALAGRTEIIEVTLSLDTSAYASGDVLADSQVVTNATRVADVGGLIQSVTLIDQDDQKVALDLYFLSANVSMGSENAAPSISDADALNLLLPKVSFGTADYTDLGGVAVAGISNLAIPIKPASGTRNIYVAAVNGTGTPTYTAAGIKLRIGILQD